MKAAGCRDVLEDAKELLNDRNRTSAKKAYDIRRKRLPMEAGLIEWEFGGGMQKQLGTSPFAQGIVFECTCLDDLFAGKLVNMARLEELFNVDRHRLSKAKKSSKTERENRLYDYSSVAAIMDSLLSEAPPKPGQPRRGRPFRLPWLHDPGDPGLRQRVLIRIRERLDTVSAADHIKNAFADVISKHLPDSGK